MAIAPTTPTQNNQNNQKPKHRRYFNRADVNSVPNGYIPPEVQQNNQVFGNPNAHIQAQAQWGAKATANNQSAGVARSVADYLVAKGAIEKRQLSPSDVDRYGNIRGFSNRGVTNDEAVAHTFNVAYQHFMIGNQIYRSKFNTNRYNNDQSLQAKHFKAMSQVYEQIRLPEIENFYNAFPIIARLSKEGCCRLGYDDLVDYERNNPNTQNVPKGNYTPVHVLLAQGYTYEQLREYYPKGDQSVTDFELDKTMARFFYGDNHEFLNIKAFLQYEDERQQKVIDPFSPDTEKVIGKTPLRQPLLNIRLKSNPSLPNLMAVADQKANNLFQGSIKGSGVTVDFKDGTYHETADPNEKHYDNGEFMLAVGFHNGASYETVFKLTMDNYHADMAWRANYNALNYNSYYDYNKRQANQRLSDILGYREKRDTLIDPNYKGLRWSNVEYNRYYHKNSQADLPPPPKKGDGKTPYKDSGMASPQVAQNLNYGLAYNYNHSSVPPSSYYFVRERIETVVQMENFRQQSKAFNKPNPAENDVNPTIKLVQAQADFTVSKNNLLANARISHYLQTAGIIPRQNSDMQDENGLERLGKGRLDIPSQYRTANHGTYNADTLTPTYRACFNTMKHGKSSRELLNSDQQKNVRQLHTLNNLTHKTFAQVPQVQALKSLPIHSQYLVNKTFRELELGSTPETEFIKELHPDDQRLALQLYLSVTDNFAVHSVQLQQNDKGMDFYNDNALAQLPQYSLNASRAITHNRKNSPNSGSLVVMSYDPFDLNGKPKANQSFTGDKESDKATAVAKLTPSGMAQTGFVTPVLEKMADGVYSRGKYSEKTPQSNKTLKIVLAEGIATASGIADVLDKANVDDMLVLACHNANNLVAVAQKFADGLKDDPRYQMYSQVEFVVTADNDYVFLNNKAKKELETALWAYELPRAGEPFKSVFERDFKKQYEHYFNATQGFTTPADEDLKIWQASVLERYNELAKDYGVEHNRTPQGRVDLVLHTIEPFIQKGEQVLPKTVQKLLSETPEYAPARAGVELLKNYFEHGIFKGNLIDCTRKSVEKGETPVTNTGHLTGNRAKDILEQAGHTVSLITPSNALLNSLNPPSKKDKPYRSALTDYDDFAKTLGDGWLAKQGVVNPTPIQKARASYYANMELLNDLRNQLNPQSKLAQELNKDNRKDIGDNIKKVHDNGIQAIKAFAEQAKQVRQSAGLDMEAINQNWQTMNGLVVENCKKISPKHHKTLKYENGITLGCVEDLQVGKKIITYLATHDKIPKDIQGYINDIPVLKEMQSFIRTAETNKIYNLGENSVQALATLRHNFNNQPAQVKNREWSVAETIIQNMAMLGKNPKYRQNKEVANITDNAHKQLQEALQRIKDGIPSRPIAQKDPNKVIFLDVLKGGDYASSLNNNSDKTEYLEDSHYKDPNNTKKQYVAYELEVGTNPDGTPNSKVNRIALSENQIHSYLHTNQAQDFVTKDTALVVAELLKSNVPVKELNLNYNSLEEWHNEARTPSFSKLYRFLNNGAMGEQIKDLFESNPTNAWTFKQHIDDQRQSSYNAYTNLVHNTYNTTQMRIKVDEVSAFVAENEILSSQKLNEAFNLLNFHRSVVLKSEKDQKGQSDYSVLTMNLDRSIENYAHKPSSPQDPALIDVLIEHSKASRLVNTELFAMNQMYDGNNPEVAKKLKVFNHHYINKTETEGVKKASVTSKDSPLSKAISDLEKTIYQARNAQNPNPNAPNGTIRKIQHLPNGGVQFVDVPISESQANHILELAKVIKLRKAHNEAERHSKLGYEMLNNSTPDGVHKDIAYAKLNSIASSTATGRQGWFGSHFFNNLGDLTPFMLAQDDRKVALSVDVSSLEPVIASYIIGDKDLLDAYGKGEDIYLRAVAGVKAIANLDPDPTKNREMQRKIGKVLTIANLYGQKLETVAFKNDIPLWILEEVMEEKRAKQQAQGGETVLGYHQYLENQLEKFANIASNPNDPNFGRILSFQIKNKIYENADPIARITYNPTSNEMFIEHKLGNQGAVRLENIKLEKNKDGKPVFLLGDKDDKQINGGMLFSYIVQGTGAKIMREQDLAIRKGVEKLGLTENVNSFLNVHDSKMYFVDIDKAKEFYLMVSDQMRYGYGLSPNPDEPIFTNKMDIGANNTLDPNPKKGGVSEQTCWTEQCDQVIENAYKHYQEVLEKRCEVYGNVRQVQAVPSADTKEVTLWHNLPPSVLQSDNLNALDINQYVQPFITPNTDDKGKPILKRDEQGRPIFANRPEPAEATTPAVQQKDEQKQQAQVQVQRQALKL